MHVFVNCVYVYVYVQQTKSVSKRNISEKKEKYRPNAENKTQAMDVWMIRAVPGAWQERKHERNELSLKGL